MVPYAVLTKIITVNDTVAGWIGVILLISVFSATKEHLGLFWADLMEESEIGSPLAGTVGAWLVIAASLVGLLGGMVTTLPVTAVGWLSTAGILIGCFLL